jgi:hypothetical protein
MIDRRVLLGGIAAALGVTSGAAWAEDEPKFQGAGKGDLFRLANPDDRTILRYVAGDLPEDETKPAVEGTCFTHPLYTPSGIQVTDLAPKDHPHHRGLFCAWVQVEGEAAGDWWGWGEKAPKDKRLILNREARITDEDKDRVTLRVINSWRADGETVLAERGTINAAAAKNAYVIDYEFKFTVPTKKSVIIGQNPFGGFCYRAKPRGQAIVTGPGGAIVTPDAVFNRSETNWPPSRWYDLTYREGDAVSGVAILDHPDNPGTTWHISRALHMLNPCIVSDAAVTIPFGEPLYLKYRVVSHDGDASAVDLDTLYERMIDGK